MKVKYCGDGFVVLEPEPTDNVSPDSEAYRCAPILERMIELLTAEGAKRVTFGEAFTQAKRDTGVADVSEKMESHLMRLAFQIVASGKIPGAPDA